ncbi:hypothetical protein HKCCE3408_05590 [Rhodobacterales bacterium HKCCE3408]|nr:hypothetical protein [Rhodobacterales bacterium HKCCE3408]
MQETNSGHARMSETARSLLRVLVASYFIVVALGFVPGTDFTVLEHLGGPSIIVGIVISALVFGLAFMVMIGAYTRLCALLLGLMTVFAAFLGLAHPGASLDIGAFWRDLALIAALMLTYADPAPAQPTTGDTGGRSASRPAAPEARAARPKPAMPLFASARARAAMRRQTTEAVTDLASVRAQMPRQVDLRAPLEQRQIEEIFEEDRAMVSGN